MYKDEVSKRLNSDLKSVLAHSGCIFDFEDRLQKAAKKAKQHGKKGLEEYSKLAMKFIADDRNLYLAMMHLRRYGGDSPGPDGLTQAEFPKRSARFKFCRELRDAIKSKVYEPDSFRTVKIPKSSGQGFREIAITNLSDRIVDRGVKQVLEPLIDEFFFNWSFGFRKGRNRGDAIGKVIRISRYHDRSFWISADISNAFDNVPLESVLELLKRYFPSEDVIAFLKQCLRMDIRNKGLLQGSPLSPLLLNLFLHHHLDSRWSKYSPKSLLIRYADDLVVMCRTERDAEKADELLDSLLGDVGMTRKNSDSASVFDIREQGGLVMLGYDVQKSKGELTVKIARKSVDRIKEKLLELQDCPNSAEAAYQTLVGWFNEQGPAFKNNYSRKIVHEVVDCLKQVGLAQAEVNMEGVWGVRLGSKSEWMAVWKSAHQRWSDRVRHAR
ncbi:reverse transcriptase domain-containing protein [Calycomorphotria hydatis]|uniref:Group II intron-encoded protein LtrA n=1 Tax=Calycomorphotria hydatis TaxID=2528027 RepID=A0A517TE10_9PLAN|nr:reverse transcriptase domain-containing protein [Calycomorphotria hydatis]QDT66613.1 Group II intron-encoded protein LtrA [Calycomorphotria hydatis]